MAVDVTTQVIIERPCAVVAEYASNPDNAPKWYVNIESVVWETAAPLVPGTRVAFVAHFLGRRLAYSYEIVEFVPGQRLVMRTAQGPCEMETTYMWTRLSENSTAMSLRNRGEPSGFGKLAAPLMAVAMRRANQKDLATLKRLLESDPQAQTARGP
jgi:hypothetical protein